MALFAALTLTGLMNEYHLPAWAAIPLTAGIMIALAYVVERAILRHLVNQEPIVLFMATLGLAYILEGLGDIIWGPDVKVLDLGLPEGADNWLLDNFNIYIERIEIVAAATAALLVAVLAIFFQRTRTGRALRAVADDHQAALSVGISLSTIWVIVWSVAGIVALVAGIMWGAKSGVQFSLSLIALKALPVLILGGFTSVPGAILGGLIIGVGEKLAEIYAGPIIGGAIENWFAYVLALVFLLVRPQGLFGEKIIERI
jgi:branched-chain amino acid transport system permease protein